jgi:hypothetical protein
MAKQQDSDSCDSPPAVFGVQPSGPQSPPKLARAQFGQSNFQVNYDPSLGSAVQAVAQGVLQTAEGDLAKLVNLFGFAPKKVPLVINIQTSNPFPPFGSLGGAIHQPQGPIYCSPINPDTNQYDTEWTRFLVVAETTEDFEFWQNGGWILNQTNGEGLSRLLASALYPNVTPNSRAATAFSYIQNGMPDCINDNSGSDQDNVLNGGAVLFLNWLTTQLGYDYNQVVQAPASSLAGTYTLLQGRDDAYQRFVSDLQLLPAGPLTSDNPFPVFPAQFNVRTRFHVERPTAELTFRKPGPGTADKA